MPLGGPLSDEQYVTIIIVCAVAGILLLLIR